MRTVDVHVVKKQSTKISTRTEFVFLEKSKVRWINK